jgi:hypothetical protein
MDFQTGVPHERIVSVHGTMEGRCRLTVSKPELKARLLVQRLKLECDEPLSDFAFK